MCGQAVFTKVPVVESLETRLYEVGTRHSLHQRLRP